MRMCMCMADVNGHVSTKDGKDRCAFLTDWM